MGGSPTLSSDFVEMSQLKKPSLGNKISFLPLQEPSGEV